jgi:hypothetical protein
MPLLAAYPTMMQRDRKRERLRICRAAWLVGVTVRESFERRTLAFDICLART